MIEKEKVLDLKNEIDLQRHNINQAQKLTVIAIDLLSLANDLTLDADQWKMTTRINDILEEINNGTN